MISWTQQVQYFFNTLLLGVVLGLFFHFYWMLLQNVRPGKRLVTLTDVLFCLFLLFLIGGALLFINAGDLRLYVWLALIVGGWIYKRWLFKPLNPIVYSTSQILLKSCGFFMRFIYRPFGNFMHVLNRMWKKLWIKGKTSTESNPEEQ